MVSLIALVATSVLSPQSSAYGRFVYPLAPAKPTPKIVIDASESPDLKAWGEEAARVAKDWYPRLTQMLATENWKAPKEIKFVFREKQDAPAWASGNVISFHSGWIRRDADFGIMIHEMTHIIQSYPRNEVDAGWLTEGIADYMRWIRYQPEVMQAPIDFEMAKYTDSYRTTARFLAFAAGKYHMGLVPALDRVMRQGKDPLPTFRFFTGKTVDEAWDEFRTASKRG